jgi:hypothetical protein
MLDFNVIARSFANRDYGDHENGEPLAWITMPDAQWGAFWTDVYANVHLGEPFVSLMKGADLSDSETRDQFFEWWLAENFDVVRSYFTFDDRRRRTSYATYVHGAAVSRFYYVADGPKLTGPWVTVSLAWSEWAWIDGRSTFLAAVIGSTYPVAGRPFDEETARPPFYFGPAAFEEQRVGVEIDGNVAGFDLRNPPLKTKIILPHDVTAPTVHMWTDYYMSDGLGHDYRLLLVPPQRDVRFVLGRDFLNATNEIDGWRSAAEYLRLVLDVPSEIVKVRARRLDLVAARSMYRAYGKHKVTRRAFKTCSPNKEA